MRTARRITLFFLILLSVGLLAFRAQSDPANTADGVTATAASPCGAAAQSDSSCGIGPRELNERPLPSDAPSPDSIPPSVSPFIQAKSFPEAVCLALGHEASANDLPAEFFTRLIWQESRFNPNARSHKGAEGIAQFMPGTARWRGLANAYEPFQALRESARWLAELREQFGNLGLAAAAYNAGPGRVQSWLSGRSSLPGETQHYVWVITGRSAEEWSRQEAKDDDSRVLKVIPCTDIAKLFVPSGHRPRVAALARSIVSADPSLWRPWGLQLIGDWSENRALADYRKLQARFPTILASKQPLVLRGRVAGRGSATWYRIRIAESTRERANVLCSMLESAGGKCLVFRN